MTAIVHRKNDMIPKISSFRRIAVQSRSILIAELLD